MAEAEQVGGRAADVQRRQMRQTDRDAVWDPLGPSFFPEPVGLSSPIRVLGRAQLGPVRRLTPLWMSLSLRKSVIEREEDTYFDLGGSSKTKTPIKKPHQRLIEKPTKVPKNVVQLIPKVERTLKMEVTTAPTQPKRRSSKLRKMKKPTVPPNIVNTSVLIKYDDDKADSRLQPL
ncbi:hypothetical protein Scep_017611 [Stephania cephalantha]|uniref:Uncharacterized protein n=1 Tax=Stephania cephalantha TaxID=152367 RepID=A0AAP0IPT9_9MAGN